MRARRIATLLLPALAACRDAVGSPPAASLEVTSSATRLLEGGTARLSVTIDGRPVDGNDVSWASRDPSTISVRDGVVRAVAPGVTYVVARSGLAVDSARLAVGFSGLSANEVGIRVAGVGSPVMKLGGGALYSENIAQVTRPDFASLFATSAPSGSSFDEATQADSVLWIGLPPGRIAAGTQPLAPMEVVSEGGVRLVALGATTTSLWIRDGADPLPGMPITRRVYVPVTEGTLDVTAVDYPPRPGSAPGTVTGTVSFEAAGLTIRYDSDGSETIAPIGDQTVMVYAEFTMPLYHELIADGTLVTLTGGSHAGSYAARPRASFVDGGLTLDVPAVLGTTVSSLASETRIWIPSPAVGTLAVGRAPTSAIGDGRNPIWWVGDTTGGAAPWARFFAASLDIMNQRRIGEETNALSTAGTVTITQFEAPGAETFGRVAGEVSIDLGYWKSGAFTSESTKLTMSFVIPVDPLSGPPRRQ